MQQYMWINSWFYLLSLLKEEKLSGEIPIEELTCILLLGQNTKNVSRLFSVYCRPRPHWKGPWTLRLGFCEVQSQPVNQYPFFQRFSPKLSFFQDIPCVVCSFLLNLQFFFLSQRKEWARVWAIIHLPQTPINTKFQSHSLQFSHYDIKGDSELSIISDSKEHNANAYFIRV